MVPLPSSRSTWNRLGGGRGSVFWTLAAANILRRRVGHRLVAEPLRPSGAGRSVPRRGGRDVHSACDHTSCRDGADGPGGRSGAFAQARRAADGEHGRCMSAHGDHGTVRGAFACAVVLGLALGSFRAIDARSTLTTSDASMRERYAGDIRDHDSRSRAWSTALLLVVIAGRLFRGAGGRSYLVCPRGDRQSSGQTSTTEAAGEKLPPPGLTSTVGRRHGTLGLWRGDPRWGIP
jgi:hypothetical protein